MAQFQTVKGFRDFLPAECSLRNYLFHTWREVAVDYGFVEYEAPILESVDLYKVKSGEEIASQLFHFEDKGGREVAMRPELTPSLIRMAGPEFRHAPKPMKWFEIGPCFRYEKPQKGRTREFYQFNCDIIGEDSADADAELIALAIDLMIQLGFSKGDFALRLSHRATWSEFARNEGLGAEQVEEFLKIIDKFEKESEERLAPLFSELGTSYRAVKEFMETPDMGEEATESINAVMESLQARGLDEYIEVDAGIVRGLAYYTGTVFELFDKKHGLRAIAGGGRYDGLCALVNGPKNDLPAVGFAMGDVVMGELIKQTPAAQELAKEYAEGVAALHAFVILDEGGQKKDALAVVQRLRDEHVSADYSLSMETRKPAKQFSDAQAKQALFTVSVDASFPQLRGKFLPTRHDFSTELEDLVMAMGEIIDTESSSAEEQAL